MEAWLSELDRGRADAAWDLFLERYRRLIFAAIRHYVRDYDDVMDAFTHVCGALRADDLRRLRGYGSSEAPPARFSTWLVVVVHNLTVDWLRARDGRRRPPAAVQGLTPLQREIYEQVFRRGATAGEAYERIRSRDRPGLRFGPFLKELLVVRRTVSAARPRIAAAEASWGIVPTDSSDPAAEAEIRRTLEAALGVLSAEDRSAVLLYVVDGLPAEEVARLLGLSGPKTVYNRVYRALAAVRAALERAGLDPQSFW